MSDHLCESADRIDKYLATLLPEHSRSKLAKLVDDGMVLVHGQPVRSSFKLKVGDVITIPDIPESESHDLTPFPMDLEVLYEDEDLMLINKPRGLASHPATSLKEPSLVNVLLARGGSLSTAGGEFRPGIVHRLDKDTTGVMVIAKKDAAHAHLAGQIEKKSAERRYFAVVAGEVDRERFTIDAPMARSKVNRQLMAVDMHGKPAITHVKTVARLVQGTFVACRLETGRTHQIRVHLSALGHPVLGDSLYAPKEWQGMPMQLHAAYMKIAHPVTGEEIEVYCDPPDDFLGVSFANEAIVKNW
jgi:23S rRNA pseudouridine1911/1915/1917 synthase